MVRHADRRTDKELSMIKVHPNLYIGTIHEIGGIDFAQWRLVNVAKTYHLTLHRWNKPIKTHPCYVLCEEYPHLLSMNWVDGPAHYYDYEGKGVERIKKLLEFIHTNIPTYNILVTCDQALSRSPSVALLYLAKYVRVIRNTTYAAARYEFTRLYSRYQPSGIADFLTAHWDEI